MEPVLVFPDPAPPELAQVLDLGGYPWKAVNDDITAQRIQPDTATLLLLLLLTLSDVVSRMTGTVVAAATTTNPAAATQPIDARWRFKNARQPSHG